ncbi:hypothetical protein ACL7TT_18365 [Microbulbifer sp. 2304DJ12-6]|uniref:hypothetical protein n=1 Tax=Microbulbifer sp. 2304DJ12-6 TaxID=3233340 RepID=UPI0039AF0129
MKKALITPIFLIFLFTSLSTTQTIANNGGINAKKGNAKLAEFDIVHANIEAGDNWLIFKMRVSNKAGQSKPTPIGKLEGSEAFSYVWPTKIDSSAVGFDKNQGILAMVIASHPDFDDTPLFDENGDGDLENDGTVWHSHWVVLVPDDVCGKGALKVQDIPAGATPKLPLTWPGLPLLIDSPGYSPVIDGKQVLVRVPFRNAKELKGIAFDGVTSGLRINESAHAPLFCVVNVFDVASGDLSFPGKIE